MRAIVERRSTPCVIDADGLNALAPWPHELKGSDEHPIVLTPHAGRDAAFAGHDDKSALDDRVVSGTRLRHCAPCDSRPQRFATGGCRRPTVASLSIPPETPDSEPPARATRLTGLISGFLAQAYGTLENARTHSQPLSRRSTSADSRATLQHANSACARWSRLTFANTSATRSAFLIRVGNSRDASARPASSQAHLRNRPSTTDTRLARVLRVARFYC